ncbi:MAG: BACON domain-containing protein [Muribaculaceae bacterium]|nr:BACON domain-containing protein [Muribaculaceae bacterium]
MKYNSKNIGRSLIGLILPAMLLLTGCGSDSPSDPNEGSDELTERRVLIQVYPGVTEEDGVIPRLTISDGYETCTELYDHSNPETMVFHYLNSEAQASVLMSASSNGMTVLVDNPFNPVLNPEALLISKDGNELTVSSGTYSKRDKTFDIRSVEVIDADVQSKGDAPDTRGDDMDFARELVMKDIIRPLSKALSVASKGKWPWAIKLYFQAMNDFTMPMIESQLYSNNELEFQQKFGEKIFFNQVNKIISEVEILNDSKKAYNIYKVAAACYRDVFPYNSEQESDLSDDFILNTANSYYQMGVESQTASIEIFDESRKYKPSIRLVSVKDQSATVCGNFTDYDGRFTVTGYYLYHNGSQVDKASVTLDGYTPYTFSGLKKGETYVATAYATVMGVTYESPGVQFRIEGDLELSASSLSFSEAGGSDKVEVTLPSEDWTWKAVSGDSWCKVKQEKENMLVVNVSSSKEDRETTVTVTATSPEGKTQEKTLVVKQKTIGDFVVFKGNLEFAGKTVYPSKPEENFTSKYEVPSILMLMTMGGKRYLTLGLPLSGLILSNWEISNNPPTGSSIMDGYKLKMFNCSASSQQISLDGSTTGPNGEENEFSIRVDLSALKVKYLEAQKHTGKTYGGVVYKSNVTISGVLDYTEEYQP